MTKLLTNNYKLNNLLQIEESLWEPANNTYYIYVADHVNRSAGEIPTPHDNVREVLIDQYRKMVFGNRVKPTDVSLVIRNVPYESNKVYQMYDDLVELDDIDFYVIVNEGAQFHVYKCLDNNMGAQSTVTPQYIYVSGANNFVFRTSQDGYTWKYMTSMSDIDVDYFSTQFYFPIKPNAQVANAAIRGAIDVIAIDGQGEGYHNYTSGAFGTGDIRVNGNPVLYRVSNNQISHANGFYTGCLMYITTGPGAGQYRRINNYISNANGNFVTLESEFPITPTNGTQYEVNPRVEITGSGAGLIPAKARAVVNALASNSISRVEILESGKNYDFATARVVANAVVGVYSNAIVRPIYSPLGGHGKDIYSELYSHAMVFTTRFANSEGNTIPTQNQYQSIGLMKDPRFANVSLELRDANGTFIQNEVVFAINTFPVVQGVNMNTSSEWISSESYELVSVGIDTAGTSGSYLPGDILIIDGSTGVPIVNATVEVIQTEVRSAVLEEQGTGYSNGDLVWVTGGAGTNAEFMVTTDGSGVPTSLSVMNKGLYTTNPILANNSTDTNGSGTGATVNITMQIANVAVQTPGAYSVLPNNISNNQPIGGSGGGAVLSLNFNLASQGSFVEQFKTGELIYLSNKEYTEHQVAYVDDVANNAFMSIHANGMFSCSEAIVHKTNIITTGEVVTVPNTTHIRLSDIRVGLGTDNLIIGLNSGAKAVVNSISRNDVTKGFDNFVQLYKYDIDMVSGVFLENEKVFQGGALANSVSNAILFSMTTESGRTIIYTSEQTGEFYSNNTIKGAESGAIASLNEKYEPELVFGSGEILYIENIEAVSRADNQTEQFKIVFEM